jgi:competence ComEA-like helix-hairpin-helix protein
MTDYLVFLHSYIKTVYPWIYLVLCCLTSCNKSPNSSNFIKQTLKQDPYIQVYFNNNPSSSYTEPYRQQTRSGDNLEAEILSVINSAKSTIDVAVQELKLPNIALALAKQQQAGVKVRVILENTYAQPWSNFTSAQVNQLPAREKQRYEEFFTLVDRNGDRSLSQTEIKLGDAVVILRQAKIPIVDDTADGSQGSGLMHHKFVIIDNQTVIVTSANFTHSDIFGDFSQPSSLGNANNLLKINSPKLANLFTQEFNLMWGDGLGGQPNSLFGVKKPFRGAKTVNIGESSVTVQFSPTSKTLPWMESTNGLISNTLLNSTKQVDLALFVFSEQNIANFLESDRQKGVQIRLLVDRDFAYRPYSDALDLMGVAIPFNCQYEVGNHPWQSPINTVGVPILPPGDLLHHKFGVIDGETVITGSHNWSAAANYNNDETLLIIRNPTVAAHFEREFEKLYGKAQLGIPKKLQTQIATADRNCLPKVASSDTNLRVNVNTASLAELVALPGVGEKLAMRIIEARQQSRFTSLEDLDRVPGIGDNLKQKLSDRVTF